MSTSSSSAGGGVGLGGGERALLQLEPSTFSEVAGGGAMVSTEDVASSGGVGGGGAGLRSPPGLPHPVVSATAPVVSAPKSSSEAQQQYGSNTATTGESSAGIKDQTAGTGGMAVGGASSSQQSPGEAQLHLRSDVNPSPTLKATPIELPIELATRQSQPASQQTTTTPGTIQVNAV